ncbi:MAG TPA: MOSC domain-containing protein [Phycisphaerae bacterium]|jgi:MOSC domain-containing protein YiiM
MNQIGKVAGIAIRTAIKGPMREVRAASARADAGIDGDIKVSANRGITFIDRRQWEQVTRELQAELPWHTRRANVLVAGLTLGDLLGKRIRLGTVEVQINAETKPCGLMDELHPGLRAALVPECRGGVYGRVIRSGVFAIGDTVTIVAAEQAVFTHPEHEPGARVIPGGASSQNLQDPR